MPTPKQYADALSSPSWTDRALPMEGRAAFLPFQDTMPGSVMNKRSLAIPGVFAGAINAITAPGRAYRGSDPTFNPQEEALNIGLNMMGGGMVASKVAPPPAGSLGIFAGSRAKTADMGALKVAEDMKASGVSDEAIHAKTGWFFGSADGKPRFEIDDSAAKGRDYQLTPKEAYKQARENAFIDGKGYESVNAMKPYADKTKTQLIEEYKSTGKAIVDAANSGDKAAARRLMNERGGLDGLLSQMSAINYGPMSSFLKHGELGAAYPDAYKIHTRIDPDELGNSLGRYRQRDKSSFQGEGILLAEKPFFQNNKSTALHELQHAIQQREGFARGGSPEMFKQSEDFNFKQLQDAAILDKTMRARNFNQLEALNRFQELFGRKPEPGAFAALERIGSGKELDMARDSAKLAVNPYESYKRLSGEAEARLTQSRMNMTAPERAASYPPSMFDVPVKNQIVRYGDDVARQKERK